MKTKIEKRLNELKKELSENQTTWDKMAKNNEWDKMEYISIKLAMLKASIQEFERILI
jgi:hypothetical protein